MTGPEHYTTAERFAEQADKLFAEYVDAHDNYGDTAGVNLIRRQAEHCREMGTLHAALAQAAATAMGALTGGSENWDAMPLPDALAWADVAGVS